MSDILSTYSFLSWLRQGITNQLTAADLDASVKLRASMNVELGLVGNKVGGGQDTVQIDQSVQLFGPGDIVGIDPRTIIKAEPRNWITNFESNYLPYLDFYDEDFPWRYTPAAPSGGRLRPWITLIVLKEDEFKEGQNMANRPLPYIEVPDAGVFPPGDQLWAWAHIHVNESLAADIVAGNTDAAIQSLASTLASNPDLAYSRLMSPRKLEPSTAYHAFLIPTFESGRLAGLGHSPDGAFANNANLYATFSAWENYSGKSESAYYPVYHRWFFRTGTKGDFEYLVRLLTPKPANSKVGRRDMDVQVPGANLSGILDTDPNAPQLGDILRLGGALRVPQDTLPQDEKDEAEMFDNWDQPGPRPFKTELAAFINLADEYQKQVPADAHQHTDLPQEIQDSLVNEDNDPDPLITAPLYGQWHALSNRLLTDKEDNPITQPVWLHDLNLDPRFRSAAGFGTRVIQDNQERYMEAAWKQIGEVLEANRRIRLAQMAQMIAGMYYSHQLAPTVQTQPTRFLQLSMPLQRRVMSQGVTLFHQVKLSRVPSVVLSPEIRKMARPGVRTVRRLNFTPQSPVIELADRVNKGEVSPAPPKQAPTEVPTVDQVADTVMPENGGGIFAKWVSKSPWLRWLPLVLALLIILVVLIIYKFDLTAISAGAGGASGAALLVAIILFLLFRRGMDANKKVEAAENLKEENRSPDVVDELPKSSNFTLTAPGIKADIKRGIRDSDESKRYKAALKDAFTLMEASAQASEEPERPALNFPQMQTALLETLNPELTFKAKLWGELKLPAHILDLIGPFEVFKEAMAYPKINEPMYKPLVDRSTELFLPNINLIESNSISLLETNQRFIESYMVGLNHEFARELLWREYTTDQRGSYFRQFWDVSSFLSRATEDPEAQREALYDIPPLHLWSRFSELGDHDHRESGGDKEEEVVLVIRGELLKKYPNAVIYAHKAEWQLKDDGSGDIDPLAERVLVPLSAAEQDDPPREKLKTPLYEAKVDPDIYFFGFDLTATKVKGASGTNPGDEDNPGWFFVLKERPGEPRFGLDIDKDASPNVWNDLSWEDVSMGGNGNRFLTPAPPPVTLATPSGDEGEKQSQHDDDVQVNWTQQVSSAELAYILFQAPVMVAIHGSEMLPK